jgi:hypothetical protein
VQHVIRRRRDLDLLAQHVAELFVAPGLLVQAIERLEGLRVRRIGVDDPAVTLDRGVEVLEGQLVDLRRAQRELDV